MFSLEAYAAAIVLLGLIMYALFGGADFGGGIWTAFASGPRAREQREALFHAIGPVWETNHVWLIFILVALFTAFPIAFAILFVALFTPLVIALIGINFRGAAFAFRHFGRQSGRGVPFIAKTFEISSILTPLALGMAVTATAAGRITLAEGAVHADTFSWLNPFTVVGGLVGLAVCAYLAPIYMAVRTVGGLRDDFRMRGILAAFALGGLTALEIPVGMVYATPFASRLLAPGPVLLVVLAVLLGTTTVILLLLRRFMWSQISAAATVAATLAGFGAAMYPDVILGQLTFAAAAAPRATLLVFFAVLPFGIVILAPSLIFLYWTFRGEPDPEAPPARK